MKQPTMPILYISDLDRTLLRDDATLSDFSRRLLAELLQEGLPFTVASARSVVSIRPMLKGLRLALPIIEFNGAFISDLESGHHEVIHRVDPAVVEAVFHRIGTFGCVPFISSFNGAEDCTYYNEILNEGMRWYLDNRLANHDPRWRFLEPLTQAFHDDIVCFTVIGHADVLAEFEAAINEQHGRFIETHCFENHYSPGWYWLTIYDARATKAQAIHTVRERYGFRTSELVVFGDHTNDITMFQLADRAIAVANATAELKGYATCVIGSNQDDSVARFIRDDWTQRKAG